VRGPIRSGPVILLLLPLGRGALFQKGAGLGHAAPAEDRDEARDRGEEKRHAPTPVLHRLLAEGVRQDKHDGLRGQKPALARDGNEGHGPAQRLAPAHLGDVGGDGADLPRGAHPLQDAQEHEERQAEVARELAA